MTGPDVRPAMRLLLPTLQAAAALLPATLNTPQARTMLLAIAGQESGCTDRCQVVDGGGRGPARGLWQMERGGGVQGVLMHEASRDWAASVCAARIVRPDALSVWLRMEFDDALAGAFARLLLFTDVQRLPALGQTGLAWAYYQRVWRPGKPHPDRWPANYTAALDVATEQ